MKQPPYSVKSMQFYQYTIDEAALQDPARQERPSETFRRSQSQGETHSAFSFCAKMAQNPSHKNSARLRRHTAQPLAALPPVTVPSPLRGKSLANFFMDSRPCLNIGRMAERDRFFLWARRFFPDGSAPGKEHQRCHSRFGCPETTLCHFSTRLYDGSKTNGTLTGPIRAILFPAEGKSSFF